MPPLRAATEFDAAGGGGATAHGGPAGGSHRAGAGDDDDAVDEACLAHLNDEVIHDPSPENVRRLKQGYQQAAVFLTRAGDPEHAIEEFREALKYVPHDQALTLGLGWL